jgi:hypothetical protein
VLTQRAHAQRGAHGFSVPHSFEKCEKAAANMLRPDYSRTLVIGVSNSDIGRAGDSNSICDDCSSGDCGDNDNGGGCNNMLRQALVKMR